MTRASGLHQDARERAYRASHVNHPLDVPGQRADRRPIESSLPYLAAP